MPDLLIGLLVALLVACLVYWAVHRLAAVFGLPPQLVALFDVVLVVLVVIYVLRGLGWLRL